MIEEAGPETTGETLELDNSQRRIVTEWGSVRGARRVRLGRLTVDERQWLKEGRMVILTNCPPAHGKDGTTRRKLVQYGGSDFYARVLQSGKES